jgi:heme A synthase
MQLDLASLKSNALLVRQRKNFKKKKRLIFPFLAGFVMKGFLGGWTLVMKSIGLVSSIKVDR